MAQAQPSGLAASGAAKIRLFIHVVPTDADNEALQLFEELKTLVTLPNSPYTNPQFEVRYVGDIKTTIPFQLPRLIDGTLWEGIEEIRTYMDINRHYAFG